MLLLFPSSNKNLAFTWRIYMMSSLSLMLRKDKKICNLKYLMWICPRKANKEQCV